MAAATVCLSYHSAIQYPGLSLPAMTDKGRRRVASLQMYCLLVSSACFFEMYSFAVVNDASLPLLCN
jgi:hypothetical protein